MLKRSILVLLQVVWPVPLLGQACLGIPQVGRGLGLEFGTELVRDYHIETQFRHRSYSAALRAPRLAGVSLDGRYRLLTSDTLYFSGTGIGAGAAVEAKVFRLSICPVGRVEYAFFRDHEVVYDPLGVVLGMKERNTSRVQLPAGLAAGTTIDVGREIRIIPSVAVGWVWTRARSRAFEDVEQEQNYRYRDLAITVGWRQV